MLKIILTFKISTNTYNYILIHILYYIVYKIEKGFLKSCFSLQIQAKINIIYNK